MLDLVIPVFNDKKGLYRTLMSIGLDIDQSVFVTVIDDCSNESYDDIIKWFSQFYPIRLIRLDVNRGPGVARQVGLDNATEDYITFVDCGDVFSSPNMLSRMLNTVECYPEFVAYFWAHSEQDQGGNLSYVGPLHNRMHGKIYNRQFLIDNDIHFCDTCSYANEDIGFNIAVRLIAKEQADQLQTDNLIFSSDEDAIHWVFEPNSLVRLNDNAYYYQQQNMGLALNIEHAFAIARMAGVKELYLLEEANHCMATEYLYFIATKTYRSEFITDSYAGAVYFYQHVYKHYHGLDDRQMRKIYYQTLGEMISDDWDPIHEGLEVLDYGGFLNQLKIDSAAMDQASIDSSIENRNEEEEVY